MINALLGDKTYPDLVIFTINENLVNFMTPQDGSFSDFSDEEADRIESFTNLEPLLKKYSVRNHRTRSDLNFN